VSQPPKTPPVAADSDTLLRAILEHGPSTVFAIDEDFRILSINRVPAGLEAADVLGTSCLDYVPPAFHATVRQAAAQVLRTGEPARYETIARGPDDSQAWYLTHVLPLGPGAREGAARLLLLSDDITARRRAETDLRVSEALFRALVAASSDVAFRMAPDWSAVRQVDGRSFGSDSPAPNLAWLEKYIPEEDRAPVRQAIDEAIRERKPVDLEHRVRRADGSVGWMRSKAVPMLDDRGGIAEWVGMASDVTERKRAEHALRESEQRLRFALEAAEEGLWDLDLVTGECYYNPAFHTMLGYPPETLARRLDVALELLHPDDRAVESRSLELLRDPGHFVLRFRMRTAAGDYRLIESRGKTVRRDAQGQPQRAVGTHLDVTERVRLEEALRRSEAQLRALVEGTTDAIFIKDLQGRYLLVNAPALGGGHTLEDTLGRDDRDILPADTARATMALDRQVMTEGKVVTIEETLELVKGQPRTFLTTKGPLRDPDGTVVGLFGIARDVTELLRKEEAQRQALQDSRDLLELTLANAELGTWDIDLTTGAARYDERYGAMLGLGRGELAPTMQAWLERLHPDDRAAVDEAVRAHDRGETRLYESEHRLRHRDGHWVWVLARGKVVRDLQGRPVRAVGTHQDVTDRKRIATEGAALLKKIEALIAGLAPRGAAEARPGGDEGAPAGFKVRLSGRNREVLGLLAGGLTAAEIAQRLGISKETANTHRRNLMRKLGLRNKAELIRYAIENGIGARPV